MTGDLIRFLTDRLDEDRGIANATLERNWNVELHGNGAAWINTNHVDHAWSVSGFPIEARHIARWDPARVLAEVQTKRRIVDLHTGRQLEVEPFDWYCLGCRDVSPCLTLRLLALPYDTHDQYREEWKP